MDNLDYTGVMGNGDQPEEVKAEVEKQTDDELALKPFADSLRLYVAEERTAIADIRSYIKLGKHSDQEVLDEYRARELYLGFLDRFENGLPNAD